jgi:ubiquinone/menaquinone biosynthesis C-methylase UbiE
MDDVMLRLFERSSRKDRVLTQYGNSQAVASYARGYEGSRPGARFFRSRLKLVLDILASCPGGDLLDAGCGPGLMVLELLKSRPHDFRIAALDQSAAMIEYCAARVGDTGQVHLAIGELEAMPFADTTFDVILVMGALEYTDARLAIREVSRLARPGALIIVTMLNPLSVYRLTEWFIFWPLKRLLGASEKLRGVLAELRHRAPLSGIHAFPASVLRRWMRQSSLRPVDTVYFDVTPAVPPFHRLPRFIRRGQGAADERTITRGWRRWLGSAYLIAARRDPVSSSSSPQPAQSRHFV